MPKSVLSVYSKKTTSIWGSSNGSEESDDDERAKEDLLALEHEVSTTATLQYKQYNPFLYDRPGFSPFQLYGRRKRGRPTKLSKLIPVAEQEAESKSQKRPRPPGVEVKRYLDELKEFTLADMQPKNKGRKRAFNCPKNRDFEPPSQEENEEVGVFDIEADQFRPCLFDFVQVDPVWKDTVMIADENELPQPKIGRPRIHPIKEKIPGRQRGRPRKPKFEDETPKEKRPRGRPRKSEGSTPKPKMIYTFERTEGNEEEIKAMIDSGMVVLNTTDRELQLVKPSKTLGRPRIHPVKEKVPGRKRGRPRVHTAKVKVPGRKRGRPPKPKVEGEEVPKEKKPKGRPRKENQTKPKIIFSFEDHYDLSPEELWKLRREGVKLVDIKKKRRRRRSVAKIEGGEGTNEPNDGSHEVVIKKRGRKKKVPTENEIISTEGQDVQILLENPGETTEKKKRGRPKKIHLLPEGDNLHIAGTTEIIKNLSTGIGETNKEKKKRGRPKKILQPGGTDETTIKEKKKRGRPKKISQIGENNNGLVEPFKEGDLSLSLQTSEVNKEKKKRGRPKKIPKLEVASGIEGSTIMVSLQEESLGLLTATSSEKRKRGRPRKIPLLGNDMKEPKKRGRKKKCSPENAGQQQDANELSGVVKEKKKPGRKRKVPLEGEEEKINKKRKEDEVADGPDFTEKLVVKIGNMLKKKNCTLEDVTLETIEAEEILPSSDF